MCAIIGKRAWFNVPVADILQRSLGNIDYGDGRKVENSAAADEVLARPCQLPLPLPRPVVPDRGHPLGRAARSDRHQGAGRPGEQGRPLAARRRDGRRAARRDAARHRAAAARPSSTARSSTPPTRPPTWPRSPSRSSRGPEMTAVSTKPAPAPAQMSRPLLAKLPQPSRLTPVLANVIPPVMILAIFLGLVGIPRQRAGGDAAAAIQGLDRQLRPDRRPVLRPRRARQGAVLAPRRQPAARGARLHHRRRRRHPDRAADRHLALRHARARPDLPGAAHRAAAGLAAAVAGRLPRGAALARSS